jgi:PAS domain S-box-containing protein
MGASRRSVSPTSDVSRLNAAQVRWLHERADEGIFTTDRDLVIQSWNLWMTRATGELAADVIGKSLLSIRPEIGLRGLDRYYRDALRGQSSILAQRFHGHLLMIPIASGAMAQSCHIAPLLDNESVIGTITVIEDVSERVNSEAELRRQIGVADEARVSAETALRAKDEFLATLSHELRTPLNAVLGWTNILRGNVTDTALLNRALLVIERNAVAQARLIDDMLDMARIVSGKIRLDMSVVDLVATTNAAIDVIRPSAATKRIVIRTHYEPGSKLIQGDAARLQQVIWNVLSNAVKFTTPDGKIDVGIVESDGMVRVVITDTGKGITPDFLPYVFDRFRQANSSTSRVEGGLGLGLALVRQLVDLHGGEVAVSSLGEDHGTSFTLSFPAVTMVDALQPAREPSPDPHMLAGHRLLIVDDDADWREALRTGLELRGAEVAAVGSATEALECLRSAQAHMTALVLDIGLPEQDGYALVQSIRRLPGDAALTPAIAVTAYAGPEHEHRALGCGFDAFRVKPITVQDVADAIVAVTMREP